MQVEQLFVEKLVNVSKALQGNPSEYDLVAVAGLLRPILLDTTNLLDRASAAANLDVKFRVVKPAPIPISPEVDEAWDKFLAVNPGVKRVNVAVAVRGDLLTGEASQPGDVVLELARNDFLKHGIIIYNDIDYTVEHVLRVAANTLGGVHWGETNWNAQAGELRKYMAGSTMFGRSMAAWYISQIALCTLRTCHPLAQKLAELGLYSDAPNDWTWSIGGQAKPDGEDGEGETPEQTA
jgi:hypothetical protein